MILILQFLLRALVLLVIIDVVLSYFMDPFHPVRAGLDRIVEPLLAPIRRVVPPISGIDLSPIVLILLIQIISAVLVSLA